METPRQSVFQSSSIGNWRRCYWCSGRSGRSIGVSSTAPGDSTPQPPRIGDARGFSSGKTRSFTGSRFVVYHLLLLLLQEPQQGCFLSIHCFAETVDIVGLAFDGPLELRHGRSELSIVSTHWQMDVAAAAGGVGFDCAATGTDDRWINGPCHGRGSLLVLVYACVPAVLPYTPCLI